MSNAILYLLQIHLAAFLKDLKVLQEDWTSNAVGRFGAIAVIALTGMLSALEAFHIDRDTRKLHREVISVGMDFTARWECWIDSLNAGSLRSGAAKVFHEQLLRWTKGASKAYRIWLIDR